MIRQSHIDQAKGFYESRHSRAASIPILSPGAASKAKAEGYETHLKWENAKVLYDSLRTVIQVPLNIPGNLYARVIAAPEGITVRSKSYAYCKLVIGIDKKSGKKSMFVVTLIPTKGFLDDPKGKMSYVDYDPSKSNFSGMALYSRVDGTYMYGYNYKDGRRIGNIYTAEQTRKLGITAAKRGDPASKSSGGGAYQAHVYIGSDSQTAAAAQENQDCDPNDEGDDEDSKDGGCIGCGKKTESDHDCDNPVTIKPEEEEDRDNYTGGTYTGGGIVFPGEEKETNTESTQPGASTGNDTGTRPSENNDPFTPPPTPPAPPEDSKSTEPEIDCSGNSTENKAAAQAGLGDLNNATSQEFMGQSLGGFNDLENAIRNNPNVEHGTSLINTGNGFGLAPIRSGTSTNVNMTYYPGSNTAAFVHTHTPAGGEAYTPIPSLVDIMVVAETCATENFPEFKGSYIIDADGSSYMVYVEDKNKATNFWNETKNDWDKGNGVFKDGTQNKTDYRLAGNSFTEMTNETEAKAYKQAAFLEQKDSGLKILKQKNKDSQTFEQLGVKPKPKGENLTPTKCP